VLAFALTAGDADKNKPDGGGSPSPLPTTAVTVAAPPTPSGATTAACVKVLAGLPIALTDGLPPRRVDTESALVRAWGAPAVVLRCGVARPAPANAQLISINDVNWLPVQTDEGTLFTTVDRAPIYVEVFVPKRIVDQPMALISTAVSVLPQTCTTIDAAGNTNPKLPICK